MQFSFLSEEHAGKVYLGLYRNTLKIDISMTRSKMTQKSNGGSRKRRNGKKRRRPKKKRRWHKRPPLILPVYNKRRSPLMVVTLTARHYKMV